jgi:hypothetical protein
MILGGILFAMMFCVVIAIIANSRGRSGFGWFFLSLIITPILSLILVLCLPKIESDDETPFTSGRYRSRLSRDS